MSQYRGEVRWFNNAKGFGFLGADGIEDVFCHFSAIQREGYKTLKVGEPVRFEVERGKTGKPQAAKVYALGDQDPSGPRSLAASQTSGKTDCR